MLKLKTIGLVLLFCATLGIVSLEGFKFYQKSLKNNGVLSVSLAPQNAHIIINGRTYKTVNGGITLKLKSNQYRLTFSYPGYSVINKQIDIKPGQVLNLGKIYLFPVSWPREDLVADTDIGAFKTNQNKNLFIYLKKTAKNYEWYIYNRGAKESQKFYQLSSLPQEIIFSPDSKKIIILINNNDWRMVPLPKSLIDKDINLNDEFAAGLKQENLQIKKGLEIKQIVFAANRNSNEILIRTNQGLYNFNYFERTLTAIIDSPISPFLLSEGNIYFIDNNGLLSGVNLNDFTKHQLSFSGFKDGGENLDNVIIKKNPRQNSFLIIKESGRAYLLEEEAKMPLILGDMIINGDFSLTGNRLLLYTKEKKIIIYDLNQKIKIETNLYSDSLPQWFLNDNYFLFSNGSQLKIYIGDTQDTWPVANDLKNSDFTYDSSLNYIFFLSPDGIIKTGL